MVVIQWYAPVNLYSPQIKKKEMLVLLQITMEIALNSVNHDKKKQSKKTQFFNEFPPLQCYNHVNSSKVLLG